MWSNFFLERVRGYLTACGQIVKGRNVCNQLRSNDLINVSQKVKINQIFITILRSSNVIDGTQLFFQSQQRLQIISLTLFVQLIIYLIIFERTKGKKQFLLN